MDIAEIRILLEQAATESARARDLSGKPMTTELVLRRAHVKVMQATIETLMLVLDRLEASDGS